MKKVIEVIELSSDYLKSKNLPSPRLQAEEVVGHVLNLPRLDLYLHFDKPLTESELSECRKVLKRRSEREPLEYIFGKTKFYNCLLKINPAVLIPRQETELLVDQIVQNIVHDDLKGKILWDLCTGSGCIGIALKKQFPMLRVILSDISKEALALAEENAMLNQVEVEFRQGDFFTPFSNEKAHYIICNPPYISTDEFSSLDPDVKNYEPTLALVSGPTGLEFYQKASIELQKHLHRPGKAWFEIGYRQGPRILELYESEKNQQIKISKDLQGHDRFFFIEIQ